MFLFLGIRVLYLIVDKKSSITRLTFTKYIAQFKMAKLILIDGNSVFHRAFHALPPVFKTQDGTLVNAVYGFTSMLLNILNSQQPDYVTVAFDKKGKTFRHEQYVEYKATRKKAPDELYAQFPLVKELLEAFSIPSYELAGFEADDIIGTLAFQAESEDEITETLILTSDRDALQLVTKKTHVLAPVRGVSEMKTFTPEEVKEKYGITPSQVPDLKGLQGDTSDNIKGVAGVGKKTAEKLIQEYGSVEGIYEHIEELKGKLKERLLDDKESAILSKHIGTIVTDAPSQLDLKKSQVFDYDFEKIQGIFDTLRFTSLTNKLKTFNVTYSKKRVASKFEQKSLF